MAEKHEKRRQGVNEIPYLKRRQQHKIGKPGRASEQRLARELNAQSRPASGAMAGAKGDMQLTSPAGRYLIEAKSTTQVNMVLKKGWLDKIGKEARSEAKTPALALSFVNEDGSPVMDGEWNMIPLYKFQELL